MNNQAYLFFVFVINGILIGILFDIFRIIRKTFKTTNFITYIEDILFWILAGILTLYFIFNYNKGEIRLYILLGIILGIITYILTISKYIVKFCVRIISYIKDLTIKIFDILLYPLKIILNFLKKLLFRPISFIFINFRESIKKIILKISNNLKKTNKTTKSE